MTWSSEELTFVLVDDHTSDPVMTVIIGTPVGAVLVMAEAEIRGTVLVLRGLHVQSDVGAGKVGTANIFAIGQAFMGAIRL